MINTHVEFCQGKQGKLFCIRRTPKNSLGNVIYLQPLFESANINRHVYTQSAILNYHECLTSIIYDHYGTGDSDGELTDTNLLLWQQDLILQIQQIKKQSHLPIVIVAFSSASLLLTKAIIELVDHVQLWQPEFSGKRVVKQLKRISLISREKKQKESAEYIEIAGYLMKSNLLEKLGELYFSIEATMLNKLACFDVAEASDTPLSPSRQSAVNSLQQLGLYQRIVDHKYWQASELVLPKRFLTATSKALIRGISHE